MTTKFAIVLKQISLEIIFLLDSITTMTATVTTAFWAMTINNPDDRDYAIIRNGYPDYCREIIHTPEEGKEGTPHIQAYIKLQRQQRISFLRKLFPGGHFTPLKSDEYVQNTKAYTQKDDDTTRGAHVHIFNDPIPTLESLIPQVIKRMWDDYGEAERDDAREAAERDMVKENFRLAKIFVSAAYKQMWKQFGAEMMTAVCADLQKNAHTHTHTHTDEKFSHGDSITNDAREDEKQVRFQEEVLSTESEEDYEGDDNDSGSESEASDESDDSECSEYSTESED